VNYFSRKLQIIADGFLTDDEFGETYVCKMSIEAYSQKQSLLQYAVSRAIE